MDQAGKVIACNLNIASEIHDGDVRAYRTRYPVLGIQAAEVFARATMSTMPHEATCSAKVGEGVNLAGSVTTRPYT